MRFWVLNTLVSPRSVRIVVHERYDKLDCHSWARDLISFLNIIRSFNGRSSNYVNLKSELWPQDMID